MSLECAAATLALSDGDLARKSGRSSFGGQLYHTIHRDVFIEFQFDLVLDAKDKNKLKLGSVTWGHKNSTFCGTCGWCCLLQEGSRRTLECVTLDSLLSGSGQDQSPVHLAQISLNFYRLEYFAEPYRDGRNGSRLETGRISLLVARGDASLEGNYLGSETANCSEDFTVSFEVYAEKDDPVTKYLNIHRRPLDSTTLSEGNLNKITGWLKDCDTNHQKCKGIQFLPTRLLYISAQTVQLIATTSLQNNTRYVALSYCWGSSENSKPPLTTTRSTLKDRLVDIPIEVMPCAFRDIVNVARALRISFIWIDSLCIIQDDSKDWQIESGRMADIFSNAYLTIIAAAGSSCHDSFLYRDENRGYYNVPFQSSEKTSVAGHYNLRHRPGINWWSTDKMSEISGHQWITRGWTFQEERLAKRTLISGENKFFFDCRTEEKVEDSDLILPRPKWTVTMHEDHDLESAESGVHVASGSKALYPTLNPFIHWQTLCDHYSRRMLTFTKDKLSAISGIASRIHRKTGSDYLGGLWRDNLVHDLFWQTIQAAVPIRRPEEYRASSRSWAAIPIQRPEEYRAPSWSWAALDGRIRWERRVSCAHGGCEMYCEILDVQVTVLGQDPFGAVSDGYLNISALILEVKLSRVEFVRQTWELQWRLAVDGVYIAMADLDIKETDYTDRKFWAVLIAKCTERYPGPRGLLLHKTGGQRLGRDVYQRVGIFEINPDGENPAMGIWEGLSRRKITIV